MIYLRKISPKALRRWKKQLKRAVENQQDLKIKDWAPTLELLLSECTPKEQLPKTVSQSKFIYRGYELSLSMHRLLKRMYKQNRHRDLSVAMVILFLARKLEDDFTREGIQVEYLDNLEFSLEHQKKIQQKIWLPPVMERRKQKPRKRKTLFEHFGFDENPPLPTHHQDTPV